MTPYVYIRANKFSKWFLLKYLKRKGYTFRNNMTQEHIFINPYGKYVFCMCEQIINIPQVQSWAEINTKSKQILYSFSSQV